ncbi:MAG: tetratricopeptide repeat protein [Planctomycetota bacterium]
MTNIIQPLLHLRSRVLPQAVLFTVTALLVPRMASAQDPQPEPRVEVSSTEALKQALDGIKALKGLKGAERQAALKAAAESFEVLFDDLASSPDSLARASFEAGECRRRLGELEAAEANFTRCLQAEEVGRYAERALFQRASMRRRTKRFEEAIADYRQAASVRPESARAHESRLWIGRCLLTAGKLEEACTAFRAALEATAESVRRIEASDRLAGAWIQRGDLVAAKEALDSVEAEVASVLEAGGKLGERVQKALDRRSSVKKLRKEADDRNDSAGEAARLERDRARRVAGR